VNGQPWTWGWNPVGYGRTNLIDLSLEPKYDAARFGKHLSSSKEIPGILVNEYRCSLAHDYTDQDSTVLEVGTRACEFIESLPKYRRNSLGYDVNIAARLWLRGIDRFLLVPPAELVRNYPRDCALCFWNSLDHLADSYSYLAAGFSTVFITTQIFPKERDIFVSPHFLPGTHRWYFTHEGLLAFMSDYGYEMILCSDEESKLGFPGRFTYIFKAGEKP